MIRAGRPSQPVLVPLLEVADSVMTYRRRYFEQVQLATTLDLLLADDTNPRALAFQLEMLVHHVELLPKDRSASDLPAEARSLTEITNALAAADLVVLADRAESGDIEELDNLLIRLWNGIAGISEHLTQRYFNHAVVRTS